MSGGLFTSYRDAAITSLRGLAFIALDDTGYVIRGSYADDSGGGVTSTFGTAGTYACRVDPLTSRSGLTANQIDERSTHVISVAPGVDAAVSDRFRIGTTDYEITAVRTRTDEQIRELEAIEA